jgi:hypothetical protein
MRQSDATTATDGATLTRQGATIGGTAKALGVSVRTVQRRIERGELSVIERDGRRLVELPDGATSDATPVRQTATSVATTRQSVATTRQSVATTRQNVATSRDTEAERIAELKAEVAFLRNVVEAQQRDAVELRQSLKRALDLAPKQLGIGDAPAMPETTPPEAPGAQQSGGYDYGALADELEARLILPANVSG